MNQTTERAILDLRRAPEEPLERLMYLSGVKEQVQKELDDEYAKAYGLCRFQGILETAIKIGLHSRKKVMAYTRHYNESVGRQIRWNDGR